MLFRSQVHVRRQRFKPEYMVESNMSGRFTVPVWGCRGSTCGMALSSLNGHLNSEKYIDILDNVMLPAAHQAFGEDFVFQQDRSPVHTAHVVSAHLEDLGINLMDWPPKGPDMSPIEHV